MKKLIVVGLFLHAAFACRGAHAGNATLKVYLLAGQSNMEGQAYTWDIPQTGPGTWNVPTMQYMETNSAYMASLPDAIFTFKPAFDASWFGARDDVWATHFDSQTASVRPVHDMPDPTPNDASTPTWPTGVQRLSPGFGITPTFGGNSASLIGVELAMGHRLGEALEAPILLFKSDRGGTTLAEDWRPPSAAAARGGVVGNNFINTIANFSQFLDDLDADLSDDGRLNNYNNATEYEVVGFVWVQGFNEVVEQDGSFIPEYAENLVDLVNDIRAADDRIPLKLPVVVVESSDQNGDLNAQRIAAVNQLNVANPGTALFIETNGLIGVNYGGLNSIGGTFSDGYGYHFHARPENFLQMGWWIGDAVLANGYTGSQARLRFLRGDCNDDGNIDISDAVCILNWLFLGGATPGCLAVTNANGDPGADLSDPVYMLNHLFLGGPAPVMPFPDCGPMPDDENMPCDLQPKSCQ